MTTENFGRPNAPYRKHSVRPYEKLPLQGVSTTTTTYDFDSIVKKIERDDERQVGEMGVERNEKDRETEMKTDRNKERNRRRNSERGNEKKCKKKEERKEGGKEGRKKRQ